MSCFGRNNYVLCRDFCRINGHIKIQKSSGYEMLNVYETGHTHCAAVF